WQSGLYYADETAKASLDGVRAAARAARGGVIARCAGLQLTPRAVVGFPTGRALSGTPYKVTVKGDIDFNALVRLSRQPQNSTTLETRAHLLAGDVARIALPNRRIAPA